MIFLGSKEMMRGIQIIALFWLLTAFASCVSRSQTSCAADGNTVNETTVMEMENENGIEAGLSGCFTAMYEGSLIVAGGCNFPENPLAPDSKKRFYKGIYRVDTAAADASRFHRIGTLPRETAYGAAVATPQGMVLIGGSNAEGSFSDVWLLGFDSIGNSEVSSLPSLPYASDNFAAVYIDGKVFMAGGNADGVPSCNLLSLDMNNPGEGWVSLAPFPGNPRTQPVLAASSDAYGNMGLYLWGGFAGKSEERVATLNTDGYKFNMAMGQWFPLPAPLSPEGEEVSAGGGVAATLPDGRIVVAGGVNKDIFLGALSNQPSDYLSHPVEWYRFNDLILLFDPKTETWGISGKNRGAARAGAGMVATSDGAIIITGGELKPRIRTSEILKIML